MRYLFILFLLIAGASELNAADFEVKAYQLSRLADSDKYQIGGWHGIQLSYGNKVYGFASYETAQVIPLWGIGDLRITGVGIGTKYNLTPRVSVFGQFAYYFVNHEDQGRHYCRSEGLEYYFNDKYGFTTNQYYTFDSYQIEYDNTVGGEVGIQLIQPLSKHTTVGLSVSYRTMKIGESLRVYRDEWGKDCSEACWMQDITRDFSSFNYGLSLGIKF